MNHEIVDRRLLNNGDIVECGGTYFVLTLGRAPEAKRLMEQQEALRTLSPRLAGDLKVLPRVARSSIPVLVLGESGTGKEGIARAIHAFSGRSGQLMALNCGALPPTLVESELFGSRRGAFSGAEDRQGLLRTAARGTLFLDEVAELPLSSQAALLRVLQEKEVIPLGGNRPVPVDVRVLSATNRPVNTFVADGKFRADLYARLSSFEIHLPPLRERREDLGFLLATFIARHDRTGAPRTLSRAAAAALFAYEWPLNIRELEQSISAALAITDGEIGIEHLRAPIREATRSRLSTSPKVVEALVASIRKHKGNMSAVARELETSRSHIYRLLRRHSIAPADLLSSE